MLRGMLGHYSYYSYLTDGLAAQNEGLKEDIQKYVDEINELGERLDDAEKDVNEFRGKMETMDQVRKQINQANMKECLARKDAQKETQILNEENKSLQEQIDQVEDRTRTELIQDRQKARRHLQIVCDEAEQLKENIESLHDKYDDERKFAEEQVLQFEMDYQVLRNTLHECETDKQTFMEKLDECDEENQELKDQNEKFEDELFEMCERNSALEVRILKQKEPTEASTKGKQSNGNTDGAGGIQCKKETLGPRAGQCKVITGNPTEEESGGGLCKGKTVTSIEGGLCKGKTQGTIGRVEREKRSGRGRLED
jgi:chromosome segregation ATPase